MIYIWNIYPTKQQQNLIKYMQFSSNNYNAFSIEIIKFSRYFDSFYWKYINYFVVKNILNV